MEDSNTASTGMLDDNMHVFSYTEADPNRLLGEAQSVAHFLSVPSSADFRCKYDYESKRFVTIELHLYTLIEYHRQQRIPRGMRA